MNQQEYFGFGSIKNLEEILTKEKAKKVFLVTGRKSFKLSGAKQILDEILKDYELIKFSDFSSNPKIREIQKGLDLFQKDNFEIIVAIGGGSCIDVAKAIKMFYLEKYSKRKISLVAIPTTAGSGSEATYFIVYYVGKEKQSKGILDTTLPDYTICDPQFTLSMPKNIAAITGIDALSQAIESYWSIYSTPESQEFSRQAIKLLMDSLDEAVNKPTKQSKQNVMMAANLAGKAINITRTTAPHSIGYPLTS